MELWKKYRPTKLKQVQGQSKAKKIISGWIKRNRFPHSVLLSGSTGVGKTTIARILRRLLKCEKVDYEELNAASERGIDTIRDIEANAGLNPMGGECRIWVLDEAHAFSRDAQGALLKVTEEAQEWVYIFLCTTNPEKLLPALVGRCAHLKLEPLEEEELEAALGYVAEAEGIELRKKVKDQIVEAADGSARNAIGMLESIMDIEDEKEQLNCIVKQNAKLQAIEIARAIVKPKAKWKEVSALLRQVKEDPEKMRRMILGYASAMMLKGVDNPKLNYILIEFESDLFASGFPGFVRACYEVCSK